MINRDILYLTHIIESIEAITDYTSGGKAEVRSLLAAITTP